MEKWSAGLGRQPGIYWSRTSIGLLGDGLLGDGGYAFLTVATAYALTPSGTVRTQCTTELELLFQALQLEGTKLCRHNSNSSRRYDSNSKNERSRGNSNRTGGSQWTNYSHNNQQIQGYFATANSPPPPPLTPTTSFICRHRYRSHNPGLYSLGSSMRPGPSQHSDSQNSRQPGTFRAD